MNRKGLLESNVIDPLAMDLMDRKNNMKAFERGVRALLDVGIRVKVDLIIGLPGDTAESVRRGLDYLHANRFFSAGRCGTTKS